MSWRDDLRYKLLGPFWPEYLVAKELRNKGWTVFRHFNCFDPDKGQYVEIDVLAVSTAPASPAFPKWLGLYQERYRWRWYFRLLHRVGYLPRYLKGIDMRRRPL